jgi:hypothetical protein
MNIYLDIDGVLLHKDGTPANGAAYFLKFITDNFDCYWLTTHCNGDARTAVNYLKGKLSNETIALLGEIKPTNMTALKTDQIDFSREFIWLDDYVMQSERAILEEKGCLNSLFEINLTADPNSLNRLMKKIANLIT